MSTAPEDTTLPVSVVAPVENCEANNCEASPASSATSIHVSETESCDAGCVAPEPSCEMAACEQPCAEPVACEQPCAPAEDEVCTPMWDYVMKPILCYKTVPYQTTAKGCKTVMVDKVVPDCKYVTKTKQVPCTVKKMVKCTVPDKKVVMKPHQVPDCKYVTQKVEVPCTKTVKFTKQVPDTRTVCKQVKVPTTKTIMKKFPVQTTKTVCKMVQVDDQREVCEQIRVPCTKTVKVPQQVCETKYVTQYKTETYKKAYEARVYKPKACLPEPQCEEEAPCQLNTCEQPVVEQTCNTGCPMQILFFELLD